MNKDERVQVRLFQGNSRLTCWVDKHVTPGNRITLKNGPEGFWTVDWCSQPIKASKINSNRDYKVGGL